MVRLFGRNGHDRSLKLLQKLYRLMDESQKLIERDIGVPICMPDCGKCCEVHSMHLRGIEAYYIALWLSKQEQGLQDRVKGICRDWMTTKHENVGVYRGYTQFLPLEAMDVIQNDVAQLTFKTPCPMLDEDKRCLIHPVRPLGCRAFGVTRVAAPSVCPRPAGRGETHEFRAYNTVHVPEMKKIVAELIPLQDKLFVPHSGFLCARLLMELDPRGYLDFIYKNNIATAKTSQILGMNLVFQEQVEEQTDRAAELSAICHPVPGAPETQTDT